jgi:hypothetical protein
LPELPGKCVFPAGVHNKSFKSSFCGPWIESLASFLASTLCGELCHFQNGVLENNMVGITIKMLFNHLQYLQKNPIK